LDPLKFFLSLYPLHFAWNFFKPLLGFHKPALWKACLIELYGYFLAGILKIMIEKCNLIFEAFILNGTEVAV